MLVGGHLQETALPLTQTDSEQRTDSNHRHMTRRTCLCTVVVATAAVIHGCHGLLAAQQLRTATVRAPVQSQQPSMVFAFNNHHTQRLADVRGRTAKHVSNHLPHDEVTFRDRDGEALSVPQADRYSSAGELMPNEVASYHRYLRMYVRTYACMYCSQACNTSIIIASCTHIHNVAYSRLDLCLRCYT